MQNRTQTEEYLRKVELPEETKTYAVISHGYIIDKIREMLALKGFSVKEELYKAEDAGKVALGFMQLENDKDPDMGMTFNWSNSYNKKVKFSCAIGGFIYDVKVPFVSSDAKSRYFRLHKGTALSDTTDVIEQMIEQAEEHFDKIIEMKQKFSQIKISRKEYAKLMGLLYFDKSALNSEQVNLVKREYEKPSFKCNHPGTLWSLYKMLMFSIVDQSPKLWYQQQIKINSYIQVLYNLATEDDVQDSDYTTESEGPISELSEEQQEMVEREFAYAVPLEETGVKPYPLESEENFTLDNRDGEYGSDIVIPETIINESEEVKELDEVLQEKEQPAVSFFEKFDKKEIKEEEKEELMCENCGSNECFVNASAQVVCDNCGHEESTTLVEDEEEEMNDMFLDEDTSENFEFVEEDEAPVQIIEDQQSTVLPKDEVAEEEVPWQTDETPEEMEEIRKEMNATKVPLGIIEPNEPGAGSHNPDNPEPIKELHTEDLFELEDEEEVSAEVTSTVDDLFDMDEDENPIAEESVTEGLKEQVVGFIERFYGLTEPQAYVLTNAKDFTIVELGTHETFVI